MEGCNYRQEPPELAFVLPQRPRGLTVPVVGPEGSSTFLKAWALSAISGSARNSLISWLDYKCWDESDFLCKHVAAADLLSIIRNFYLTQFL